MNVLIDTSVWSRAFRRSRDPHDALAQDLETLIDEGRAMMIGPVRQELLSGIRTPEQFNLLKNTLRAFLDLPIGIRDYEQAAEFFNRCRSRGIQGSNTDFLICAVAARRRVQIFTDDRDFSAFAAVLPIKLYQTR